MTTSTKTKQNNAKQSEAKQVEVFETLNEGLNVLPSPIGIRNDCQIGQFKIGRSQLIGTKLKIIPVAVANFIGDLGQTKGEKWDQLWFATVEGKPLPNNLIYVTYLKKESKENFDTQFNLCRAFSDPGQHIFECEFEKTAGEMGNYYFLNFSYRAPETKEEQTAVEKVLELKQTNPTFCDSNLPQTMIFVSDPRDPVAFVAAEQKLLEQRKLLKGETK